MAVIEAKLLSDLGPQRWQAWCDRLDRRFTAGEPLVQTMTVDEPGAGDHDNAGDAHDEREQQLEIHDDPSSGRRSDGAHGLERTGGSAHHKGLRGTGRMVIHVR